MITDAQLRLSNAQDLATPAAGTIRSTNTLNLLSAPRNVSRGHGARLIVTIDEAFAGGTSLNITIATDDNTSFTTPTVKAQTGVVALANLNPASKVLWDTPLPDLTEQYVELQYITVGDFTTGKVSAHIVAETDYQPYMRSVTGL